MSDSLHQTVCSRATGAAPWAKRAVNNTPGPGVVMRPPYGGVRRAPQTRDGGQGQGHGGGDEGQDDVVASGNHVLDTGTQQ